MKIFTALNFLFLWRDFSSPRRPQAITCARVGLGVRVQFKVLTFLIVCCRGDHRTWKWAGGVTRTMGLSGFNLPTVCAVNEKAPPFVPGCMQLTHFINYKIHFEYRRGFRLLWAPKASLICTECMRENLTFLIGHPSTWEPGRTRTSFMLLSA